MGKDSKSPMDEVRSRDYIISRTMMIIMQFMILILIGWVAKSLTVIENNIDSNILKIEKNKNNIIGINVDLRILEERRKQYGPQ